jgi:hypothetical protein
VCACVWGGGGGVGGAGWGGGVKEVITRVYVPSPLALFLSPCSSQFVPI